MKEPFMTNHAALRNQQRTLPQRTLYCAIDCCAAEVEQREAEIFYLGHAARQRLSKAVGERVVSLPARLLNACVIFSERGTVITTAHRCKRVVRS